MQYTNYYESPLGKILLACDEKGLTGLWLENDKYFAEYLDPVNNERETKILTQTKKWLDIYFSEREPDFMPPVNLIGTSFQVEVWKILRKIPYGYTTTYGEIAKEIAYNHKIAKMSAQAVGGAVGHNGISIIIPCHRVVGTNGSLTGYGGGIDRKIWLLKHEGVDVSQFFVPNRLSRVPTAKGSAL